MPFSCFLFHPRKSCEKHRKCSHTNVSNASVIRFSTPPAQTATFAFTSESGYTLGFRRRIAHSGSHAETGAVSDGGAITPSERFTRFGNPAWPGYKTANFAAFGSWSEALLKDTESLRDSDALMRVAVPRRRGPAGLRDLFYFCRNRDLYIRRSWFSACARQGWYHYSRCAPHAAETPGPRLSKRLTCRFLVSPIYICESPRRMQPISASIQIACCWISRGHIACPWLIQA